jgi:hypothetical protein
MFVMVVFYIVVFCTVDCGQFYLFMVLLCSVFPEPCTHKVSYRFVQAVRFAPLGGLGGNVKGNFQC